MLTAIHCLLYLLIYLLTISDACVIGRRHALALHWSTGSSAGASVSAGSHRSR